MQIKEQVIVYVNFTPYENSGYILDYLKNSYKTVLLFSFNFHKISQHQQTSKILIYHNCKLEKQIDLYQIPLSIKYAFILLPLRSTVIFMEIFFNLFTLRKQYGPCDVFFTVNAFIAWTGMIMKKIGLVKTTVFWVWDYYPTVHKSISILIMRKLYWLFDSVAIRSDKVIFLTRRLMTLHAKVKHFSLTRYPVIGIGTKTTVLKTTLLKNTVSSPLKLAFLGAIKKSQGLESIFDAAPNLLKRHNISVEIFGGGPDEAYIKQRAKNTNIVTNFHGYIPDSSVLAKKIRSCHIGIALYKPEPDNVSYFGDPSKIKAYIESGLPVITTDVFEFHNIIEKTKSGIVISYGNQEELINAISSILKNYKTYSSNAIELSRTFEYKEIYSGLL